MKFEKIFLIYEWMALSLKFEKIFLIINID